MVSAILAGLLVLMMLWNWALRRSVKRRTQTLLEHQEKLRALFDASPDAMWVKDHNGIYRDCNEGILRLLGKTREEVIGKRHAELFPGARVDRIEASDRRVLEDGERDTYVLTMPQEDGTPHHYEIIKVPLRAPDGSIQGLLGVARDITDRLNQEAQLRLWALAFQHAEFGVAILDARTCSLLMVNPTFARQRGYRPEDMTGLPLQALHPSAAGEETQRVQTLMLQSPHSVIETEHVTRDGRQFPVLLDCSVSHDGAGSPLHVVMYAQDISQRRQTDIELRLAAVAFETLEPMMVLDANGLIQRVNTAFTRLTGFSISEVAGHSPAMLFAPRPDGSDFRQLWPMIRHESFWQGEQWITARHGPVRIVRLEISAVPDEHGVFGHYV
jgi:PAS domain S-box-containing protein